MPDSAQCPACGIYFFKWGQAPVHHAATQDPDTSGWFSPMPAMDPTAFYGRCLAWVLLSIWSWSLIRADYTDGEIFDSFMHNILLPIHEAGHVFLMPFGEFLTILGGSLFQLALPLAIGVAFLLKNRDNFAASLCFWWVAVSLLDLSPYIYDALHPQLTMLGGHTGEDGPHDWIYLLGVFGQIQRAQHWGAVTHTLGVMAVLFTLGWALLVLVRQRGQTHDGS